MQESVILKKGMKIKDLPDTFQGSFRDPFILSALPEFSFSNGTFNYIEYLEWEPFICPIPWNTKITLDCSSWEYKFRKPAMSMKSQIKMAEIAMNPDKHGLAGTLSQIYAKGIIWC